MFKAFKNRAAQGEVKQPSAAKPNDGPKKSSNRSALLLLLLLMLAGGGYLQLNNGGLDDVVTPLMETIDGLLGGGSATPPAAPIATAPAPRPRAARNKPADSAAPGATNLKAASGQINGQPFKVDHSEFRDGVLTLVEGNPKAPKQEMRIFLFTRKGEVPSGKTYRSGNGSAGVQPHIHIAWKQAGQSEPVRKSFTDDYSLQLEFSNTKGDKLPGMISVELPDGQKSGLTGSFTADIEGFSLIDGKPNLAGDSNDTLVYVALSHLLTDDPSKPIQDVVYRNASYTAPRRGATQTGNLDVEYRIGNGRPVAQRFHFTKDREGWKIKDVTTIAVQGQQ